MPLSGRLTHVNEAGEAHMVDVGEKRNTHRVAVASATVQAQPSTLASLREGSVKKGDVLSVARIAGIMAAKKTSELIPLCHSLALSSVDVEIDIGGETSIIVEASARTVGPTGVEMEALTAVSIAALTIYDMCKAVDRGMAITDVVLLEKSGGRSGHWKRPRASEQPHTDEDEGMKEKVKGSGPYDAELLRPSTLNFR